MSESLLGPVGLDADDSALYVYLLSTPRCTTAQLADAVGSTAGRIRPSLERLAEAGLITRLAGTPVRFTAAPPEAAVDALATRREKELDRLRTQIRELAMRHQGSAVSDPSGLVELVDGSEAMGHRVEQMQLGAQHEVLITDCPPYIGSPVANPIEFQLLRRGIAFRAIYHGPSLEGEGRMKFALQCVEAGEQARSVSSLELKMLIVDRRAALIPLSLGAARSTASLYVRPSPLLAALTTCFDLLWDRGTPIGVSGQPADGLDERDRQLLTMLAGGMKDTAIMRQLGITQRTMTRRVGLLLTALDAQTRFQAGMQAARRGWL